MLGGVPCPLRLWLTYKKNTDIVKEIFMSFEVEYVRSQTIALHNLSGMDDRYCFYYDESNNFRKFRIKEKVNRLNAPINSNFVLGGVVHEKDAIDFDYYKLVEELNLQKTVEEIKFKNIAKGDFIQCLKSDKLKVFLDWLIESDLYIHYFVLNLFYFSIVDIVDSAISNSKTAMELPMDFVNTMKSNLYTIAKRDEKFFVSLLLSYNYPNLHKLKIADFSRDILEFIRRYEDESELHVGLVSLRQILKESISKKELVFLENNTDYELIESFEHFYLQPIYMFMNSTHEFDEESSIFESLNDDAITYKGEPINNYKQSNSKESKMVQISDVVVGLLAKYCDYVIGAPVDEIKEMLAKFDSLQQENFNNIRKLIEKSNTYNKAFLHYSISTEDRIKFSFLES